MLIQGATYTATGSGSWSPPSSVTQQAQKDATTTTIGLADTAQTTPGATGTLTSQFSVSGATLSGPQLTDVLIALRQPPPVVWFHHDQLGSTRALTDGAGRLALNAGYDPYGNLLGVATVNSEQVNTNLLFSGQYRDSETGLYYLRARYYDPTTGQFLSRDPAVAMTRSPYGYVGGNPLNASDPTGLGINLPGGFCLKNPFSSDDSCQSLGDQAAQSVVKYVVPTDGADYKTTEIGIPFFDMSLTVTKGGAAYVGAGPSASLIPASIGQREGRVLRPGFQPGQVCENDIENLVSGFGFNANAGFGDAFGGTISNTTNGAIAGANEQGWGTPQLGISDQYFWRAN